MKTILGSKSGLPVKTHLAAHHSLLHYWIPLSLVAIMNRYKFLEYLVGTRIGDLCHNHENYNSYGVILRKDYTEEPLARSHDLSVVVVIVMD